jgi:hypothetical protein
MEHCKQDKNFKNQYFAEKSHILPRNEEVLSSRVIAACLGHDKATSYWVVDKSKQQEGNPLTKEEPDEQSG